MGKPGTPGYLATQQTPSALLRVLGDELRHARKQRGWVRKDVQARLGSDMSLQTLATYELGTRGIGVVRFVDICAVLEVYPPELLARALQRITDSRPVDGLHINLRAVVRQASAELLPLKRWAQAQLASHTAPSTSARLSWPALEQLAELCDLYPADLVAALRSLEVKAS
jgi:transcriptional regulator with XRE-family HTH domain